MDCVIPAQSVRSFCAALSCLCRIGKEIYVEFHPLEGLALRTLNDAKSAYSCFRWTPSYFERCTLPPPPPVPPSSSRKRPVSASSSHHPPSTTQDSNASAASSASASSLSSTRFCCRIPIRALTPIVRARKNVTQLRVHSVWSSLSLLLEFEFSLLSKNPVYTDDTRIRVVHRIGVTDAVGVSAVAPREHCSEIITSPRVLLRLLEPLKRTTEASLIIRRHSTIISAASFHHSDTGSLIDGGISQHHQQQQQQQLQEQEQEQTTDSTNEAPPSKLMARNVNAVVQAAATISFLKTETSIEVSEFDEFDFCHDRDVSTSTSTSLLGIPVTANEEAILVFPVREARAMLQYCAHQAHADHELRVIVSFQYGGKPMIIETNRNDDDSVLSSTFHAELVLATLDDHLLQAMHTQPNTPMT
jgi:hypothetical protein